MLDENDVIDYFSRLQNQEKLKAGEIIHGLNSNIIKYFLDDEEIDKFCKLSNFNDSRRDFTKHFNVFAGICLKKIRIGLPDRQIIDKMESITIEELKNNSYFSYAILKFKNEIKISNIPTNQHIKNKLSILGIKILFLSYVFSKNSSFWNLDILRKVDLIKKAVWIAGCWNSRNVTILKDKILKEIIKNLPKNSEMENNNIFCGFEKIWELGKTTHNFDEIKNKFELINKVFDSQILDIIYNKIHEVKSSLQ